MADFFITVFRRYENKELGTGEDNHADKNQALTDYFACKLKGVNYLPSMRGQIRTDWAPTQRSTAAGGITNVNLPEQTLQVSIGSKLIPTLPIRERQQVEHLAMSLGLESKREGFMNPVAWHHNKNVWGCNLEVYSGTDRDNAGMSTRAGESIQLHFENLGLVDYFPDKIYLTIRSTSKLELRTASARLLD